MELGILKIVISLGTVVALAEIAKRVDPVLSGVFLGLPLGAGLAVYFIAYEQGLAFLIQGIPWAIAGLAASVMFCTAYLFAGRRFDGRRLLSIVFCSLVAMGVFFVAGAWIRSLDLTLLSGTILFLAIAMFNLFILRWTAGVQPAKAAKPLGGKGLLLRGVLAGLIILGVTMAAPLAGSQWAGILSSFPSTLYALLVIVHFETGNELYPSIINGFAHSVPALAVFYLGCVVLLPILGLNLGFIGVYVISAGYIYLTHYVMRKIKDRS
ncbi:MAG: hypothetical protein AB9917_17095 [Negativicutes bacterium]